MISRIQNVKICQILPSQAVRDWQVQFGEGRAGPLLCNAVWDLVSNNTVKFSVQSTRISGSWTFTNKTMDEEDRLQAGEVNTVTWNTFAWTVYWQDTGHHCRCIPSPVLILSKSPAAAGTSPLHWSHWGDTEISSLYLWWRPPSDRQQHVSSLSLSLSLVSCDWNIPTVAHRLLTDCTSLHTAGPALQTAADNQPCMTLNTWQLLSGRLLTADCARPGCSPLYRRLYGVQYTPHVSLHSIDQHIRRSPPLRQSRWRGWSSVQCPARAAPVLQRGHLTGTSRHSVGLFTAGHQQKLSQHFIILQHRRFVVLTVSQWWHINVSQLISSLLMEAYSVYCCAVWSLVSQLRPGFL